MICLVIYRGEPVQGPLLWISYPLTHTLASAGAEGGLDFGTLRVMEEVKQTLQLKNRGKYEIIFR